MNFFFTIALICCTSLSYSQTHKDSLQPRVVNESSSDSKELNAYKLLYETAKSANDDIRETTQWTVGIVIGFIILILGGQAIFNWRINKKELENIKNEYEAKFIGIQNTILREAEKTSDELKKNLEDLKKENKEYLKDRFSNYRELNQARLDRHTQEVDKKLLIVKADVEENAADIWILRGVEANALSSFIQTAIYKLEANQELKYTLEDISKIVAKIEELHESDYNKLDKLFGDIRAKLKHQYDDHVKEIEAGYKNKPVYVYDEGKPFLLARTLPGFLPGRLKAKRYIKNEKK